MFSIRQFHTPNLNVEYWNIAKHSSWCVLTKNTSSENSLLSLFEHVDKYPSQISCELLQSEIAVISFQSLQQVYEHELKIDETDITDEIDFGTQVQEFIPKQEHNNPLIDTFELRHKMNTGFRQLSTGESRKLLMLKAILGGAKLLVCENPFDSLDVEACSQLNHTLKQVTDSGVTLVLLINNLADIPDWMNSFVTLVDDVLTPHIDNKQSVISDFFTHAPKHINWPDSYAPLDNYHNTSLCDLRSCTVAFQEQTIFNELNFNLKPLQHTLVTGKNGSGKSTLLQLITGDCPQCFSNDVTVFGYRRGQGETIWDIKKHIGLVSSELHRSYRVRINVITVVVSGFFDSIGIYQNATSEQVALASQFLDVVGLKDKQGQLFHNLTHGEQRLVLIARALVKSPLLLILDEPTQGLDQANRLLVLNFLKHIVDKQQTTILYVSHREDEHLPLFNQHFKL